MEFSEYENIEIFNNTQSFSINKCEDQIISHYQPDKEIIGDKYEFNYERY
jgi:hypothetical protein